MKPLRSFKAIADRFPALQDLGRVGRGRSVPFVQQLSATECGAACLAMVLKFHGRTVGVEELRNIAVGARDASDAQTLIDAGRLYGLRGRAVSLEMDQLMYLEPGTILHWGFTHFVVLDRIRRDGVEIVDPARGRCCVPMEQFRKKFTGVALQFVPTGDFTRGGDQNSGWWPYLREVLSERSFLPHIVVTSVVLQVLGLGLPLLNRTIIDGVIPQQDYHLLGAC